MSRHTLALTARAIEGASSGLDDAPEAGAAGRTGLPRSAVDRKGILELTLASGPIGEVVQRRPAFRDRPLENLDDGARQAVPALLPDPRYRPRGVDAGAVQRLGSVDVANTDQQPAVHEEALHRSPPALREPGELVASQGGSEGLGSEVAEVAIAGEARCGGDEREAEPPGIPEAQALFPVEAESQVLVHFARRRLRGEGEPAAHSKVDHQRRALFELDQKVLAPAPEVLDPPAGETSQGAQVERLPQRRGMDLDLEHPSADKAGFQTPLQHFDFRQLRHRPILPS